MAKHVLATEPQLVIEFGEQEVHQPAINEQFNQEQEVHARVLSEKPESHREQLQWLLPTLDYKKLVF